MLPGIVWENRPLTVRENQPSALLCTVIIVSVLGTVNSGSFSAPRIALEKGRVVRQW